MTHLRVLGHKDDTNHGKAYSDHEAHLHADQSRGRHGDQPHDAVVPAGAPLSRDVHELPQCPTKAHDDDTGKNTLLEGVEERRKEQKDEKDNHGADQTGNLSEEQRNTKRQKKERF